MTFRLVYRFGCLLLGRLRLLARSSTAKDVEILVLRHQLAILQRSNPRPAFSRGDRAVLAGGAPVGNLTRDRICHLPWQ
ncbi:hypothetical protein ABT124_41840 [Streptomyces sp. NPDC001982]|uniref:hypothetical protein n=1 Tax=Streptomyces sp. NPDC001982 TaxID=3154405 RepID=UPI00331A891B